MTLKLRVDTIHVSYLRQLANWEHFVYIRHEGKLKRITQYLRTVTGVVYVLLDDGSAPTVGNDNTIDVFYDKNEKFKGGVNA